jgi:hypothetical protein
MRALDHAGARRTARDDAGGDQHPFRPGPFVCNVSCAVPPARALAGSLRPRVASVRAHPGTHYRVEILGS